MLLVPYTSKKRVFTEGPNTYFCVGKDGPSVPNSLQKSDFYVRIAHPHVCSCLRRTHIKMEIQKKKYKKDIRLLAVGAGGSSHPGPPPTDLLIVGSVVAESTATGPTEADLVAAVHLPPPDITGPVPADPTIEGLVAADPAAAICQAAHCSAHRCPAANCSHAAPHPHRCRPPALPTRRAAPGQAQPLPSPQPAAAAP